jgi:hypothetical protein
MACSSGADRSWGTECLCDWKGGGGGPCGSWNGGGGGGGGAGIDGAGRARGWSSGMGQGKLRCSGGMPWQYRCDGLSWANRARSAIIRAEASPVIVSGSSG